MDDKLQYANMLEIPVQTATVTTAKPTKKRAKPKKASHDEIKEELLNKINSSPEEQLEKPSEIMAEQLAMPIDEQQDVNLYEQPNKPTKRRFKLNAISIQLLVIGALIVTILITNSVYPNSGLNVFMRGIFGTESVEEVSVDDRDLLKFGREQLLKLRNVGATTISELDAEFDRVGLWNQWKYNKPIA